MLLGDTQRQPSGQLRQVFRVLQRGCLHRVDSAYTPGAPVAGVASHRRSGQCGDLPSLEAGLNGDLARFTLCIEARRADGSAKYSFGMHPTCRVLPMRHCFDHAKGVCLLEILVHPRRLQSESIWLIPKVYARFGPQVCPSSLPSDQWLVPPSRPIRPARPQSAIAQQTIDPDGFFHPVEMRHLWKV